MKKILIISYDNDTHIPFVTKHLDFPIQIIDPARCIYGTSLSYQYKGGKLTITFDGNEIKDIRSVWYRKPYTLWADTLPVDPAYTRYCETAIFQHTHELYTHFSEALWVSDYYALLKADYKSLQAVEAAKLGFHIPETLFTSDSKAAKAFVSNHTATIVKSQAMTSPITPSGKFTMFYSHKIGPEKQPSYSGLNLAPSIFQQAINHKLDLRVTVVGKKVFAAAASPSEIDASLVGVRDWRAAHFFGKLSFKPYQLPRTLEEKCATLVQQLGLKYGAIDLILDKHGKYWFLENNPNGEWAFIEQATGQPIGKAIAKLLNTGGKKARLNN